MSRQRGGLRPALPHQKAALEWAKSRGRIALLMEMRLGKMLVAIRWAHERATSTNNLVIAPLSTLEGWRRELLLEGVPADKIRRIGTRDRIHTWADGTQWHLTNYEAVRARPDILSRGGFTCWILDESPRIKNPSAQVSKLINAWAGLPVNRAILTGLPAPESPLEYYQQFAFLAGGRYPGAIPWMGAPTYWHWRERYFRQQGYDWIPEPGTAAAIREAVRSQSFVLTRKQAGVGSHKARELRTVELPGKARKAYRAMLRGWETGDFSAKYAVQRATWLARICGGSFPGAEHVAKTAELLSLIGRGGELSAERVVVWFRFNDELRAVGRALGRAGIPWEGITGDTELGQRSRAADRFRKGRARALLVQIKCGRYGLDFSQGSAAIYYSNGYSLDDRSQSEDRVIHPTKREPVLLVDLVAAGTIDELAADALREKRINARLLLSRALELGRDRGV